jgi:hypothetical protein
MKLKIFYLLLVISSVSLLSCSDEPISKITFQNLAAGDVIVSFRGSQIEVNSQATVVLQDIGQGEYEYETIFSVPFGTTDFGSEGEMSGNFIIRPGIKILVIYTSVLNEGTYTIYASVTTSEDLSENWWEGIIDPIGN